MPQIKTKTPKKELTATPSRRSGLRSPEAGEVLLLAETAAYLRVSPEDVLRMVQEQALPGRRIGKEWRFLKTAIQDWLRSPGKSDFWQTQLGAFKDDPQLEEMLRDIYHQRGRPVNRSVGSPMLGK